jgi:hypothetical protein
MPIGEFVSEVPISIEEADHMLNGHDRSLARHPSARVCCTIATQASLPSADGE